LIEAANKTGFVLLMF